MGWACRSSIESPSTRSTSRHTNFQSVFSLRDDKEAVSEGPLGVYPLCCAGESRPLSKLENLAQIVLVGTLRPDRLEALKRHLATGISNLHPLCRLRPQMHLNASFVAV